MAPCYIAYRPTAALSYPVGSSKTPAHVDLTKSNTGVGGSYCHFNATEFTPHQPIYKLRRQAAIYPGTFTQKFMGWFLFVATIRTDSSHELFCHRCFNSWDGIAD
jgi:hypothetical protein